jgi:hypothetical protein
LQFDTVTFTGFPDFQASGLFLNINSKSRRPAFLHRLLIGQSFPHGLVPQGTLRKVFNDLTMSFFAPFNGFILVATYVNFLNPKAARATREI